MKMILKTCKSLMVTILLIVMSTNAFAGWNIYKQIELRASDKNMFRLDRVSDNKIRAWFILARKAPGVFQNRFALYQVDNNPVRDLNEVKGTAANKNADQWLIWPISNSLDSPSKLLLEIINGKEITFQYYLPDGMIKESKFKLEGIKQAIEELGSARSR